MAVACAILQNPLARHRRHQRRQSAPERRAGEARASGARRRSPQPVLQGIVAEFEVLGLPPAPRSGRRGAGAVSRDAERARSAGRICASSSKLAQLSRPRPDSRPDKRDRRRLMRLQRDQILSAPRSAQVVPPDRPARSSRRSPAAASPSAALCQTAVASPPVGRLRRWGLRTQAAGDLAQARDCGRRSGCAAARVRAARAAARWSPAWPGTARARIAPAWHRVRRHPAMISAVLQARSAGLTSIRSGMRSRRTMRAAISCASMLPRRVSARSKSSGQQSRACASPCRSSVSLSVPTGARLRSWFRTRARVRKPAASAPRPFADKTARRGADR